METSRRTSFTRVSSNGAEAHRMHLVEVVKAYLIKLATGERSQKAVVLGTQFADAIAAQRRHSEAIGDQRSPLASLSYSTKESMPLALD